MQKKSKMRANKSLIFLFFVETILQIDSFKIDHISARQDSNWQGKSLRLMCTSDSFFEFCTWIHKDRICEFKWQYRQHSVLKQVRKKLLISCTHLSLPTPLLKNFPFLTMLRCVPFVCKHFIFI